MFKNSKAAAMIATALAVLAGAVAGCGSSGDSATTETTVANTANASFVRDVEAICVDVNGEFRALNDSASDSEPHVILRQAAAHLRSAQQRMEAVEPPADIASDYDEFVKLLGVQADALADRSRALKAGDDARARAAETRGNEANTDQDLIAQGLDLDACAASAEEERPQPGPTPFGAGS